MCPKTCFNFKALCTGETAPEEGKHKRTLAAGLSNLGFKGTLFHRIIPNFMIQVCTRSEREGARVRDLAFDPMNMSKIMMKGIDFSNEYCICIHTCVCMCVHICICIYILHDAGRRLH